MSFRSRLFLLFALVAVVMVIGSIASVSNRFSHYTREQLREEMEVTPGLFDSFQRSQMDNLINRAANISTDPSLRGALSTGDRATIVAAAEQTAALYDSDLFWLVSQRGELLYRVDSPTQFGDDLSRFPVIQDVRNGYDSGDLWYLESELYQIAAVPISSGSQSLGILLIGSSFERGLDQDFSALTGYQLAFVRNDTLVTCSDSLSHHDDSLVKAVQMESIHPDGSDKTLPHVPFQQVHSNGDHPKAPFSQFALNGERYAGALFELSDASGSILARGIIYQSLDPLTQLLNRIRGVLIGVGVAAIILALILTFFVARGLTSPINRLVASSKKLGEGDLDSAITVQTNDEIGTLAESLEAMRVSLKKAREELIRSERLSTIGRMASTITHDFRQPITTIYGFMQLTAMPNTTQEKRQEYSKRVLRQIDRMQSMITELLDYAKGEVVLQQRPVNVDEFLQDIVTNFAQDHRAKSIQLQCNCGWRGVITIDRGRIERVLENIVRNAFQAIEATSGEGEVQLNTAFDETDRTIVIRIQDNGPGIPEEIRAHLFEAFFTHGKKEGTGLGLAVAARVVEEHGGEILVESEIGKGTTFEIRLPVPQEDEVIA